MTIQAIQPAMQSKPAKQPGRSAPRLGPRFGMGLGDALANLVGKVDSSKILELSTTDILGMDIPRTVIEQKERGPDAAREEAIRNFSATFTNVFLAGLYSYAFIKVFGKTKFYNPKGIPANAFINAESLSAYGRMMEDILANPKTKTLAQAQKAFYERALSSLQSGDYRLGTADFAKASEMAGLPKSIAYRQGLSQDVLKKMSGYYGLDEAGRTALNESKNVVLKKTLLQKLGLKKAVVDPARAFYEGVIEPEARLGGLTEKVNMIDSATGTRVMDRNRKQLLKEIDYFGQHYLSRAFDGVSDMAAGWKDAVVENLTKKSTGFLPKVEDGLIPYAMKSKLLYSKWPVVLTLGTAISVAFFNNWLTKRKHGGVNFFPGEGGPTAQGQAPAKGAQPSIAMAAPALGTITRRPAVFSQFDLHPPQAAGMPGMSMTAPRFGAQGDKAPRFGAAPEVTLAEDAAKMAFKTPVASKLLKTFDFQQLGDTSMRQVQFIYGAVIASRIQAAAKRSKNEVFETVTRDPVGWLFWFYATPMLQRVFLNAATKFGPAKQYRAGLIAEKVLTDTSGVTGLLKKLNWHMNPLMRYDLPTRGQIVDRKAQFLQRMLEDGVEEGTEAFTKASKYFDGVLKWRNLATGLGIANTIFLLGVGLKLLNIAVTRNHVKEGHTGR